MSDTRPNLLIVEDDPGLQRQLRWAYEDYQLFIAGDRLSLADLLLFAFLDFGATVGQPLDPACTNIAHWFAGMKARPGANPN